MKSIVGTQPYTNITTSIEGWLVLVRADLYLINLHHLYQCRRDHLTNNPYRHSSHHLHPQLFTQTSSYITSAITMCRSCEPQVKQSQSTTPFIEKKMRSSSSSSRRAKPAFDDAPFDKNGNCLEHNDIQLAEPVVGKDGKVLYKEVKLVSSIVLLYRMRSSLLFGYHIGFLSTYSSSIHLLHSL